MKPCQKHWKQITDWNDDKSLVALVLTMQLMFGYFDMGKYNGSVYAVEHEIDSKGGCVYCVLPEDKSKLLMQRVFDQAMHPEERDILHLK